VVMTNKVEWRWASPSISCRIEAGMKGFWSLVKRGINGVYHSVSPQHLQAYFDEYSFRYNFRDSTIPMFRLILNRAAHFQAVAPSV